jgi:hypothetical protein
MIEIVINYDKNRKLFIVYEPTTETLFLTASLGESFLKLSQFLKEQGMIESDILQTDNISYHIDSASFIAMVESNANLLKRLSQAPSGFTISSQRFGVSPSSGNNSSGTNIQKGSSTSNFGTSTKKKSTGTFSKSGFKNSNKKFGGNN